MVDVTPTGNSATDILNAGYLADYYQINHIKADFTNFDDVASRNAFISNASDKYGVYAVIGGSTPQSDLTDYISYIRSHSDRKFAINFEYSTTKSIIENYLSTLNELDINLFVGVFTANTTYREANIWWADGVLSERNNLNYDDWRLNSKY